MAEKGLLSAGDPPSFALAVSGNLRTGPCGHAGPPYGRTEHGRSRGARGRTPRDRKGVNPYPAPARGSWHMGASMVEPSVGPCARVECFGSKPLH